MKFFELIEQTYIQDIKKSIKDSLVALKIQGQEKVETNQVLKDFKDRGLAISYKELINYIGDDPMIKNINRKYITFDQPSDDIEVSSKNKVDDEKLKVQKLAKKQIDKNMQD